VGTALKEETHLNETDIGTLRCLVCNHPSKKMDTDTPYVVPDFRNTLGYFHDENNDIKQAGTSSPIKDPRYRFESPPRTTMMLPEGTKSLSKFAKLRSVPGNSTAEHVDQYQIVLPDGADVTEDHYGPRTTNDPKTIAFYNDMTRQYSQERFDGNTGATREFHSMLDRKNSNSRPRSAPPKKKGTLLR